MWLYYKVYTGALPGAIEHVIIDTIPSILAAARTIDRWFFLRYTDEAGRHLRIRFLVDDADQDRFNGFVVDLLEAALASLPTQDRGSYRPVIPYDRGAIARSEVNGAPRIEREVYRPEIQTFGARGIAVAEQLFEASSRTALQVLADERAGRYSRKMLVPVLMSAVADHFMPEDRASSWRAYADYWLQFDAARASAWRSLFASKWNELATGGVSLVARDADLPPQARSHVDDWRRSVAGATSAYRRAHDERRANDRNLAFQFVHRMNNCLGLSLVEESYFATLLALQSAASSR